MTDQPKDPVCWAIIRDPVEVMSHGFHRKDFADVDVVLVIRPRLDMQTACNLIADTLTKMFAPPTETLQ